MSPHVRMSTRRSADRKGQGGRQAAASRVQSRILHHLYRVRKNETPNTMNKISAAASSPMYLTQPAQSAPLFSFDACMLCHGLVCRPRKETHVARRTCRY